MKTVDIKNEMRKEGRKKGRRGEGEGMVGKNRRRKAMEKDSDEGR